jgi:hypothetical protein
MNTVIRYTYDERLFGGPQAKVVAEKNSEKVARAEEASAIDLPRMPKFVCEMKKDLLIREATAAFVAMDEVHINTIGVQGSNSKLPYRMSCGTKLWLTVVMKQAGEVRIFETKKTKFKCLFCSGEFVASKMIEHMAWHRHHDVTFNDSRVHAAYPCGSCGLESVQKGDPNGCQVWMMGTKKAPSCHWICKSFLRGQEQKKGLKSWEKVSQSAPSCDFPLTCPMKDCAVVHWKNNMEKHFSQMHKGATMDQPTKKRILVQTNEVHFLMQFATPGFAHPTVVVAAAAAAITSPAAAAANNADHNSDSDSVSDRDSDDNEEEDDNQQEGGEEGGQGEGN